MSVLGVVKGASGSPCRLPAQEAGTSNHSNMDVPASLFAWASQLLQWLLLAFFFFKPYKNSHLENNINKREEIKHSATVDILVHIL